jgi:hypothetical protein
MHLLATSSSRTTLETGVRLPVTVEVSQFVIIDAKLDAYIGYWEYLFWDDERKI